MWKSIGNTQVLMEKTFSFFVSCFHGTLIAITKKYLEIFKFGNIVQTLQTTINFLAFDNKTSSNKDRQIIL